MPALSPSTAPNSTRSKLSCRALTCASFTKSSGDASSTTSVVLNLEHRTRCENCFGGKSPSKASKRVPSFGIANRTVIFFGIVAGLGIGRADEKKPTDTNGGDGEAAPPPPYQVKVLSFGMVEIGRPVLIGVYGSFADELLKNGMDSDPETVRKNLKLYLNGVAMEGLFPVILPPEAAVGVKTTDPKPALVLQFVLERDSNSDLNRKAWDSLLPQLQFGPQRLQAGVGLNGKVPHLTPAQDLQFQVRDPALITVVIVVGSVLLAVGMLAVICSGMVRETGPGTPYSLGKTQMAFWGHLVAISFLAVWLIGHRMERIPPQVLILIGISGATGLGSVLMNPKPAQPAQFQWFIENMSRWFADVISDGNGVSFQRLQVVIWTLILGFVFAWTVANTCSMPEFENKLLVLMGISNGLYLGTRFRRRQSHEMTGTIPPAQNLGLGVPVGRFGHRLTSRGFQVVHSRSSLFFSC
jgi:hypothetical protein